jgi:FkbM family methyltransferase
VSALKNFNKSIPRPLRLVVVAAVGLLVWPFAYYATLYGSFLYSRFGSVDGGCPLSRVLSARDHDARLTSLCKYIRAQSKVVGTDQELGLIQVQTPSRAFWLPKAGRELGGFDLVTYLVAEHAWMGEIDPNLQVQSGSVVVDGGGHVGTFTSFALARGASRVIAFEPDPVNMECFRRNFAAEISSGRVVLVPKALWHSETSLSFTVSEANSGMGSAVISSGSRTIDVPAVTLDETLGRLGVGHIDYLKMDIEGAERHALNGAMKTLSRDRPRLLLESYHLPDDPIVLRGILRRAHAGYAAECGPCEMGSEQKWRPHVIYYR